MESLAIAAFLTCLAFPAAYFVMLCQYHVGDAFAWRTTQAPVEPTPSYLASQMPAMAYLDGKTSLAEAKRRAMMDC